MRVIRKGEYIEPPLNEDGTIHLFKRDKVEFCCEICKERATVLAQSLTSYGFHYNKFPQKIDLICPSCSRKKAFLEKYGVENISQLEETKEKVRKTNLEKFGVEHPAQSEEIKEKTKKTNLEKYGVENAVQNKEVREKITKTFLEKYGVENISQLEETKEKVKKTNLERFGVRNYSQTKDFNERVKKTSLEKYGTKHPTQSKEIQDKKVRTNLEKYGVEAYAQTDEFKKRFKETCLEKYDVEHFMRTEEFSSKVSNSSKKKFEKNGLRIFLKENNLTLLEKYNGQRKKVGNSLIYKKYKVQCKTCGKRFRTAVRQTGFSGCPVCYPKVVSLPEEELFDFMVPFVKEISRNDRTIIPPFELDIVIPEKKLAIEFNGIYWHSVQSGKDRSYHLGKTIKAEEVGYSLVHIFEDEWINKKEIVKSIILSKLGIYSKKIYARKCIIKDVSFDEAKKFFEENHLQGYAPSSVRIGLYHEGVLVSCLAFSKSRYNKKYDWEISRFANVLNTTVMGGFSKLFKHFLNTYNGSIITYSDRRLFSGNLYRFNGFKEMPPSPPSYFYFKNSSERFSRVKFQKHKLKNLLEEFDENLTEKENMENNGYKWIYDCGNWCFVYEREN